MVDSSFYKCYTLKTVLLYFISIVNSWTFINNYSDTVNWNAIISKLPDIHCQPLYANHPLHESLLYWDQFGSIGVLYLCLQSRTLPIKKNSSCKLSLTVLILTFEIILWESYRGNSKTNKFYSFEAFFSLDWQGGREGNGWMWS